MASGLKTAVDATVVVGGVVVSIVLGRSVVSGGAAFPGHKLHWPPE